MESIVKNIITQNDIEKICNYKGIDYSLLKEKTIYITGITGTIGSFMLLSLLEINKKYNLNIKVIGAVRNIKKAKKMFLYVMADNKKSFRLHCADVTKPVNYNGKIDYIIHCANNTSSRSFVEKPVETFDTAVNGTENILKFAKEKNIESMVFLSSMEVYGSIETPVKLKEDDFGILDVREIRNSYPVGKRAAEMLCNAFSKEYNVPVKTARLAQVIGANVDYNDMRVYAQFARSITEKKNIVLNTPAKTTRSYCYITDVITGIFTILLNGENGQAYNIANETAAIRICDMAKMLTEKNTSSSLVFDIKENNPYFKETHWILDCEKIKKLGWSAEVSLEQALDNLINSFYFQLHKKPEGIHYKNFSQKLFSIKNSEDLKIITILGLKFKMQLSAFCNVQKIQKKYGIDKHKIVFSNYMGNNYGCNPKYITEELLKRNLNLDIVWLVQDWVSLDKFPKQVRTVRYSSPKAMFELATAKIWVDNYHKIRFIKKGLVKHPEQRYIQTWHGSLGIKKIEKQVNSLNRDPEWTKAAAKNSAMTDYWISDSKFETEVYKESFWNVKEIKEFGHPRNDIFFKDSNDIKDKVYSYFKLAPNTKMALYVPSFREDENLQCYNLDYEKMLEAFSKKFGGDWVFLVRFHPRVAEFADSIADYQDRIINATKYPDIQELLVSSEIAITDYSSCIFDFMLSRKPGFIYAPDINKFDEERGFYYPLNSTPFPIAENNTQMADNITNFNITVYKKAVEIFLKEKGCMEDGNAAKRTVDLIESLL